MFMDEALYIYAYVMHGGPNHEKCGNILRNESKEVQYNKISCQTERSINKATVKALIRDTLPISRDVSKATDCSFLSLLTK